MNIIFLTDLDGTMLSHDNFSCDSIKNDIIDINRIIKHIHDV